MTENSKPTQYTLTVYIKAVNLFSDMQEHMTFTPLSLLESQSHAYRKVGCLCIPMLSSLPRAHLLRKHLIQILQERIPLLSLILNHSKDIR